MSDWASTARQTIAEVHMSLPQDASPADNIKVAGEAYPLGIRAFSPYKIWLNAGRKPLCKYCYQPKGMPIGEIPMEHMMRQAKDS